MKAEKIFKDQEGNRYKVSVTLETSIHYGLCSFEWNVDVVKCLKGKRKFSPLYGDRYTDRRFYGLNREEVRNKINTIILDAIPKKWILEVQEIIIDALKYPCI